VRFARRASGHTKGVSCLRLRATTTALIAIALVAGCAGPSRTDDDYRHKVANTAESFQGYIGTVQVAVDAASRGKVPGPYLSVTLAEADDDASSTADNFDAIQPPSDEADKLRDRIDTIMQEVVSALDDLRIAVRRGEIDQLPALAAPLADLDAKLDPIVKLA
jgi:hypothetical protein